MADDKHDDKKDGKKGDAKAAAPAADKGGGIKAILGPALASILLLATGGGITYYGMSLAFPPASGSGAGDGHGAAGDGHGAAHGAGAEDGHDEDHSVLHQVELDLGAVKSNIIGQSGKRYIMMEVAVWLDTALGPSLAGGGHGGGPTSVVRILKSALEEHLASYQLADFDSEGAARILEKKFGEIVDRELRQLYPKETRQVTKLVHKVVITGRMMQ
jgi:hypothetical protein